MKERGITDGLTMNQLAERNAEYVMTIAELEEKCAAMTAKLSMINDLMEAAEQVNKLAQEAAEKLVQECNALAAENGQMLRLLTNISENHDEYVNQDEYLYAGVPMDYVSEINSYVSRDVDAENPFKETDAFLAEVRAQGVEMAIVHIEQTICPNHETILNEFATKLRKGGAQ